MRRLPISARVALAGSLLTLLLLAAAAAAAGYFVEGRVQQGARDHQIASARSFVRHGEAQAETKRWHLALARELAALGLGASLMLIGPPDGKRLIYNESTVKHQPDAQPTATNRFPLADGAGRVLLLDIDAPPLDRTRRVLIALAAGAGRFAPRDRRS